MLLLGNHFKKKLYKTFGLLPRYIALFSCCSCSKVFSGLKQDKSTPKQFFRSAIQTEPQGTRAKVETSLHAFKRLQEKACFWYSSPFRSSSIFLSFWLLLPSSKHINFHLHTYSGVHLCLIKGLLSLACKVLMLTIPL